MSRQSTRTRTAYAQVRDGEVVVPPLHGYKLRCCDCGLVHRMTFAVVRQGGRWRVAFSAVRDKRATAACRRTHAKRSR